MAFTGPEADEAVFLGPEDDEVLDEQSLAGSMGSQLKQDYITSMIATPIKGAGSFVKYIPGGEEAGQAAYDLGSEWERQIEMDEPVSPEMAERFPVQAAGAVGQALGMASETLLSGGLGLAPRGVQAVGLGTAGLAGAGTGEDLANLYGVEDPMARAIMVAGGGAIEAGTEAFGGLGSKGFTEALLGSMKSATRPGNVAKRFVKTAGSEGLEEVVAGEAQDQLTKFIVDEDPNRPGYSTTGAALPPDFLTMENLKNRLQEGALGAIGGAVFAGAEALGSRTRVDEALSLRMQARSVLSDLQGKETLTPEEQSTLDRVTAEDQNLSAWLERQGFDAVRPALYQIIANPETPENERTQAAEYASLIDNLGAVEASPETTPEEKAAAHQAVENHPLNGLNPLARTRQESAVGGVFEERLQNLKRKVDEQVERERRDPVLGPLTNVIDQTVQDLQEVAPESAAALQQIVSEPITPQENAVQIPEAESILPREQVQAGETGGGRVGVGQVIEGQEATQVSPQEEVNAPLPTPQVQEQLPVPQATPVQETVQPAPVSAEPGQSGMPAEGVAVPATPAPSPKPKLRRRKVRLGLSVSPREVERAVRKFSKIGGVRIASVAELAQDPVLRQAWFDSVPNATEEMWNQWVEGQLSVAEGLSNDGTGQAVIIPQNLVIYDTDASRAKRNSTSAGEEAMIRVLFHENWHGIERWLRENQAAKPLLKRYESLLNEISEEELDDLARRRYQELSDWRGDAEIKRLLQSEVMAERREAAELSGEPDSLIDKFLAWLRDVFKAVTGSNENPSPDELQEIFDAWHRAQTVGVVTAPIQLSQSEIPQRPEVALPEYTPPTDTGNTLEEVLGSMWRPFYVAWESQQEEGGLPLDQAALTQAWQQEVSDPDYLFGKDWELRREKKKGDVPVYSPTPSQTAPEIQFSQPELTPEQREARLKEIAERLSYTPSTTQQEGQTPAQATQDQRQYATDGSNVEMYRGGSTNIEQQALAKEAIELAADNSPDGMSEEFGNGLMSWISGETPTYKGLPNDMALRQFVAINLQNRPQTRAQIGIDGGDLKKALQQNASQFGAGLQATAAIYKPLQEISNKANDLTDTEAKKELGTDDYKGLADTAKNQYVKDVTEAVPDVLANKTVILEAAQNDADEIDYMELGFEGMDPKLVSKIRELNDRVERLGMLKERRAQLIAAQQGPAASRPQIPEGLTLAELDKLIAEEATAIKKLTEEIDKAEKKATKAPKEKKPKKQKVAQNASFYAYVEGAETADLAKFDDLVKKYISPAGFNRESFFTLLSDKFQQADPNFIMGVVNRVADALDGAVTEEGANADTKKTVNYDARAKRRIVQRLAKDSKEGDVEAVLSDPLVEITKKRMKGEMSAADFRKAAEGLGIESQTAYALLQDIDEERAKIGDAKAQREVNSEAKRNMEKALRDSKKSENEALAKIDQLAREFTDTPNLTKKAAGTALKALSNSFLGKEGPPITEEQFLEGAAKLNLTEETAQNLLKLLSESRRRDAAVRYAKASQKAQEAKQKAIDAMVKKLDKVKNPSPKKLKQRSAFVNSIMGAMETGILDSEAVKDAFAQAYDLHGLTNERLKEMGELLQKIESLPEGMVKETLFNEYNVLLNSIAPTASFITHAHSALMGYVLSGASTMAMQLTGLNRFINPLSGTVEILWSAPGTVGEKLGRTINPKNFFRLYLQGLQEMKENLPQVVAGMSGLVTSTPKGLGASPTSLASVIPRETSLSYTPWAHISQYRFKTPKLLKLMGLDKMVQATRYPAWMVSRSFQVIRAAEGIVGGADKNMQWRAQMTVALMQQNPNLSWSDAYSKVADALGDKTTEMWKEAYKQADEEISNGLVAKSSRKQRATELAQDKLEEQWNARLKNRPRELSALYGYKQDPITPLGAWLYSGMAGVLNRDKGPLQALKFSFLFARFFSNALESAWSRTPLGGLTALAIDTSKSEGKMDEREKRIVQMFGSLQGYKDARMARAISGTAVMSGIAGLMILALKGWDPDDDEPPFFWITGDPIGEFSKKGLLESNSWWKANTVYIGPLQINYVNSAPEQAITMGLMGSLADRFMFDKLLNYTENKETGEYERSNFQAYGKPMIEAMAAPWSRSTFSQWKDMLESAYDGNFTKLTKAFSNPIVGTAVALSPAAMIPSVKTLEKADRASEQPRSAQTPLQAAMGSVPFADEIGLDAGKPLTTPFGQPLTPFPFWSVFSNSQEVPPEVSKAARLLTDLGVSRMGPREEYFGWGMAEIAHDGRKFLLSDAERSAVLQDIGTRFANKLNAEAPRLRKLEAGKEGRKKVRDVITDLAGKARSEALSRYRPNR